MKKIKYLLAMAFATVLCTTLVHASMYNIPCNTGLGISYGYARASDNASNTLYQTIGECYQSNAMVALYVKDGNGTIKGSATASISSAATARWKVSTSTNHSHWAASQIIY